VSSETKSDISFIEIKDEYEVKASVNVIQKAFKTVADEFSLTKENAPTNAAFIDADNLKQLIRKGGKLFGVLDDKKQIGFVVVEKADNGLYYMEKLAVIPEYRHKGIGTRIIDFVFEYVREHGGDTVSIGIIDENSILKNWYKNYGFLEIRTSKFEHLPFNVCYMAKKLD
jgi:ribosomal protein S18 acetylase RimI-like enzyme